MGMMRTGVDLIEVNRIAEAIERNGDRFLHRIYTERELETFRGNTPSLAARYAAKEAVSKALGTGIGDVKWVEIEILRGPNREPVLHLHGRGAEIAAELGLMQWSISLSHTREHAVAMIVAQ